MRLADIAARANLSVSTVSMALAGHPNISGPTKKLVKQLSRQLGYAPPMSVQQRQRSEVAGEANVALLICGARIDDPAYAAITHELTVDTQRAGMRLQIGATPAEQIETTATQLAESNEAMILVGLVEPALLNRLASSGVTCIVIGYVLKSADERLSPSVTIVAPDDQEAGRLATSHLIERGHTRVGFICEHLPAGLSHSRWLTGYRVAHIEAGMPLDDDLIHVAGQVKAGGGPAAEHFAKLSNPPTALVAPDAPIIATFFSCAAQLDINIARSAAVGGGDPERAASYGLGDVAMVYCDPRRLGTAAYHALMHAMRGESTPGSAIILHPQTSNLG